MAVPQEALHTFPLRGNGRMKKLPEGNVVKTMHIEGATIHFCDDFVARTPEALEKVKRDFHKAGMAIIRGMRERGIEV